MYPLGKYRYFFTTTRDGNPKVIAISTYAGKTVRGVAVCHPNDSYDEELGKRIAATRCAKKIAEKRYNRAVSKKHDAFELLKRAVDYNHEMETYVSDAKNELNDAVAELNELMSKVGE